MWQSAFARSCRHGAHKCALRRGCGASDGRCIPLASTTAASRRGRDRRRHIHHLASRLHHRPSWAADEGPYLILQRVSDIFNMLDEEFIKEKLHVFDFETVSWYGCNDF